MLTGHSETVWRASFSMCGTILATVSSDMSVRIWNISAKKCSLNTTFKAHESWVGGVVYSRGLSAGIVSTSSLLYRLV